MTDKVSAKNIVARLKGTTPKFWKKVRRIMIVVGSIGGGIVASPVLLPAVIVGAAGYCITIGIVGTCLSSLTVE